MTQLAKPSGAEDEVSCRPDVLPKNFGIMHLTKTVPNPTLAHLPDVRPYAALPRIVSLFDMLQDYLPFYRVALELQEILTWADLHRGNDYGRTKVYDHHKEAYTAILAAIRTACEEHGLPHTAEMAADAETRKAKYYDDVYHTLTLLNGSLTRELGREAIFRIHPDRKRFYEQEDLFGPEVAAAFPSCERDIRKAGSCYALEQEDACVHHLMLVLERGLNALAKKRGVNYLRTNWGEIIDGITKDLKTMPKGPDKDFYLEVNAQFGFLKDAYRNHTQHARDEHYDLPKALSIMNHVESFMRELADGGLAE
jgi:hypothetical protein